MSATPRPWTDHYDGPPTVMGDGHVVACSFEPDDVRLIVRSVNSLPGCVDALRNVLDTLRVRDEVAGELHAGPVYDRARAALKAAEEK